MIETESTTRCQPILRARRLARTFGRGPGRVEVLHGVDLDIREGEFAAVTGPSGCGKSTLLHLLGLMDTPDDGELFVGDRRVSPAGESVRDQVRRETMGFVFQRFNLLNVLTAAENVAESLKIRRRPAGREAIRELLASMGVGALADRKPPQMSIGEQQRVAIARAVAHEPAVLLADEPTGSLDTGSAQAVMELLIDANRRRNQTIVMITHSPAVAAAADRVLRMKDGRLHES